LLVEDGESLSIGLVKRKNERQTFVRGLSHEKVEDIDSFSSLVESGLFTASLFFFFLLISFSALSRRHQAFTDRNNSSSRSHLIYKITVHTKDPTNPSSSLTGHLFLIDLAGSERVNDSGVGKDPSSLRFSEACNINNSLLVLGNVMEALYRKSTPSYRESKLTFLLSTTLSHGAWTTFLLHLHPLPETLHETINTLKFGVKVQHVELKKARKRSERRHRIDAAMERKLANANQKNKSQEDLILHLQTKLSFLELENSKLKSKLSQTKKERDDLAKENSRLKQHQISTRAHRSGRVKLRSISSRGISKHPTPTIHKEEAVKLKSAFLDRSQSRPEKHVKFASPLAVFDENTDPNISLSSNFSSSFSFRRRTPGVRIKSRTPLSRPLSAVRQRTPYHTKRRSRRQQQEWY